MAVRQARGRIGCAYITRAENIDILALTFPSAGTPPPSYYSSQTIFMAEAIVAPLAAEAIFAGGTGILHSVQRILPATRMRNAFNDLNHIETHVIRICQSLPDSDAKAQMLADFKTVIDECKALYKSYSSFSEEHKKWKHFRKRYRAAQEFAKAVHRAFLTTSMNMASLYLQAYSAKRPGDGLSGSAMNQNLAQAPVLLVGSNHPPISDPPAYNELAYNEVSYAQGNLDKPPVSDLLGGHVIYVEGNGGIEVLVPPETIMPEVYAHEESKGRIPKLPPSSSHATCVRLTAPPARTRHAVFSTYGIHLAAACPGPMLPAASTLLTLRSAHPSWLLPGQQIVDLCKILLRQAWAVLVRLCSLCFCLSPIPRTLPALPTASARLLSSARLCRPPPAARRPPPASRRRSAICCTLGGSLAYPVCSFVIVTVVIADTDH
ncbi:hypothetical protein GGX14DRAFT_563748 [Mycena pura]|uniref:Uncharacterized protein n=1 Tax=Mycena pura TaxID=153505 RepID=A0AAD6VLU8_9AGAR|nr:hypothetical protein GGX14DRAFT_563748 [Mycena pura]